MFFRELLEIVGIRVESSRGLHISQSNVNATYKDDAALLTTAITLLFAHKHQVSQLSSATSTGRSSSHSMLQADSESFWRRVDNENRRFTDKVKCSGILGESQNLNKTKMFF